MSTQGVPQTIKVEASIRIDRPVEEVFAFLADHRNDIRWQEGLLQVRVAPNGATGMDTQVTTVRKLLDRRTDSTVEICEFIPNRKESFRTVSGSPVVSGSLVYEPSGAGTLVTQRLEVQPGTFFSLPQGVVAGAMRRNIAAGLAEAKDLLERAARGPG